MRRLTLRRETLAALTSEELSGVAGGASAACPTHYPCATRQGTLCYVCDLGDLTERTCLTVSPDLCSS